MGNAAWLCAEQSLPQPGKATEDWNGPGNRDIPDADASRQSQQWQPGEGQSAGEKSRILASDGSAYQNEDANCDLKANRQPRPLSAGSALLAAPDCGAGDNREQGEDSNPGVARK